MNAVFGRIAEYFTLNVLSELGQLIKTQMIASFNQQKQEQVDTSLAINKQPDEINKKLQRLDNRFIDKEQTKELYTKDT